MILELDSARSSGCCSLECFRSTQLYTLWLRFNGAEVCRVGQLQRQLLSHGAVGGPVPNPITPKGCRCSDDGRALGWGVFQQRPCLPVTMVLELFTVWHGFPNSFDLFEKH